MNQLYLILCCINFNLIVSDFAWWRREWGPVWSGQAVQSAWLVKGWQACRYLIGNFMPNKLNIFNTASGVQLACDDQDVIVTQCMTTSVVCLVWCDQEMMWFGLLKLKIQRYFSPPSCDQLSCNCVSAFCTVLVTWLFCFNTLILHVSPPPYPPPSSFFCALGLHVFSKKVVHLLLRNWFGCVTFPV